MNCPVWYPWAHTYAHTPVLQLQFSQHPVVIDLPHTHTIIHTHTLTLTLLARFSHTAEQVSLSLRFAAYLLIGCGYRCDGLIGKWKKTDRSHPQIFKMLCSMGRSLLFSRTPSQSCVSYGGSDTHTHTHSHTPLICSHMSQWLSEMMKVWETLTAALLDPILSDRPVQILIKVVIICEIWVLKALWLTDDRGNVQGKNDTANNVGWPWCVHVCSCLDFLLITFALSFGGLLYYYYYIISPWAVSKKMLICQPGCSHAFAYYDYWS